MFKRLLSILFLWSLPLFVFSADKKVLDAPTKYGYKDPLGNLSIPLLINAWLRVVIGVVGAVFLLMFIYGGFLWLSAGGSADRVKHAQQTLYRAVIGLVIILFSGFIINLIFGLPAVVGS